MNDPVVRVSNGNGEILYTVRIIGNTFQPKVYNKGVFTVSVGDPDTEKWKVFNNVSSRFGNNTEILSVEL